MKIRKKSAVIDAWCLSIVELALHPERVPTWVKAMIKRGEIVYIDTLRMWCPSKSAMRLFDFHSSSSDAGHNGFYILRDSGSDRPYRFISPSEMTFYEIISDDSEGR